MPPATDASFGVRSMSNAPAPDSAIIISVALGALVVFGTATVLLVWFFRRRRDTDPDAGRTTELYIHKRFLADATAAPPLLPGSSQWGIQDDMKSSLGFYIPNSKVLEVDSLPPLSWHREEKPLQEFRSVSPWGAAPDMSGVTTDLLRDPVSNTLQPPAPTIDPHRPNIHKFAIPPSPAHPSVSTVDAVPPGRLETKEEDRASPLTADSCSLYSQPSVKKGPNYHVSGTPTGAGLHVEDAQLPRRVDTFVVSRMLKERAGRCPQPLTRSVSKIERQGSIQSYCEEKHHVLAPPRSVKKRQKKSTLVALEPLPEPPSSPPSSTSSKRTIRQNGISLGSPEPLTPPTVSFRDPPPSPMLSSSSTVHIIRQFPVPPAAGPSVVRTNAGAGPHNGPSSRPVYMASSRPDAPRTVYLQTEIPGRSEDDDEGETSPMLRTTRLSHKAQVVTLPRHASILPSVYPDAARYHDASPQKVRRSTVRFEHG